MASPTAGEQAATPVARPAFPSSAECRVGPRSLDSLRALAATPAADIPPASPSPDALPEGEPADVETTAEVNAAVREWVACANSGDPLRIWALLTDELLVRQGLPPNEALAELATPLATPVAGVDADFGRGIVDVGDVRLLPDGRVSVLVSLASARGGEDEILFIFVEQGGRWLVDDQAFLS